MDRRRVRRPSIRTTKRSGRPDFTPPGAGWWPQGRRTLCACCGLAAALAGPLPARESGPVLEAPQEAEPARSPETVRVDVRIEGLEGELQRNAEAVLGLKLQEGDDLTPARARALHRRAPEELEAALAPLGRYRVSVQSELVDAGDEWTALYRVDPGPVTLLEDVDVELRGEGAADSALLAIADSFALAPGDTLRHDRYEALKAELHRYATNYGYFAARFDSARILVDRRTDSADIVLHFDMGPRYRFGPITIDQDVLEPEYLEGYVTARKGEPFDASLLRDAQVDLTTGPWFGRADVKLDLENASEDLEVPVAIELSPSKPQRFEIGLGYGTDTGFRGTVGAKFRRLNRKAHNAEAEFRLSQIETSIGARYNIPRPYPSTAVYSAFGSYGDVSPTWSSTRIGTAGVSRSHVRGPLQETVSLEWESSSFEVADQQGDATLVVPQIQWSWVESNDRIVATRGHRLNLTVNGALDAVLSTASFASSRLDAKLIRPFGARMRAIARATVGYMVTDPIADLPPTRRFVTGGDQSVRGYAFESLGPENENGDLIGGKALLIGSLEADVEVIRDWRLAVFGDAGNALADLSQIEFEFGAGAGIRWVSPIGMIRLDGAFAVSEPGTPFRVHFVIGPDL